ncbi:Orcokinin peptides [Anthophora quadrimaculata]
MASRAASVLLLIAAATAAFSATVLLPTVQAETNALRRDVSYEPASPDFFVGYIDDRGEMLSQAAQEEEQQASRLVKEESDDGNEARYSRGSVSRMKEQSRYLRDEEERLGRNLDQIGGGNLLRRGLQEERNLDHIGGGNLVRKVDAHRRQEQRNLDKIGGGNLVRELDGVLAVANHLRRNLDQIGGGNLVRSLAEPARSRAA